MHSRSSPPGHLVPSLWEQPGLFHSSPSQGHGGHPLQRNKSDRSSDRYSHRSHRRAEPTQGSCYHPQGRSTDYPVKSSSSGYFSSDMPGRMSASNSLQWKGSADTRIGNGIGSELGGKKDHWMRKRAPDSASELSCNSDAPLLRKSSVASVDRHSYSESSQSSYAGSMNLTDQGYAGPVHTRSRSYHQGSPVPLLLDTGTPASSQSDLSDGQMRPPSRVNYYSLPRSPSSFGSSTGYQENELKKRAHAHSIAPGHSGEIGTSSTDEKGDAPYPTLHQQIPPSFYPSSPSFSSDDDEEKHQPWYEEDVPCVHSGLYWPPEASSGTNCMSNGKLSVARAYPTPPSHSPSPGPGYYQYEGGVPSDGAPYSYHHPLDDHRRSYSPSQTSNLERLMEYNEQKILSQHRLERFFNHRGESLEDNVQSQQSHDLSVESRSPTSIATPRGSFRRVGSPGHLSYDSKRNHHLDIKAAKAESTSLLGESELWDATVQKKASRTRSVMMSRLAKKLKLKGEKEKDKDSDGDLERNKKDRRSHKRIRKKSSSINNLADLDNQLQLPTPEALPDPPTPVAGSHRLAGTPATSPGVTPKMNRSLFKRRNSEPDLENIVGGMFRSGSRRNLSLDPTEALFESIEAEDVESCKRLLEDEQLLPEINSTNDDDWTPLDLAAMLNDPTIAVHLLLHGAKDSPKYYRDPDLRYQRVLTLLEQAEKEASAIGEMMASQGTSSNSAAPKDLEKQLHQWKLKANFWNRLKTNIDRAGPPGPPREVTLVVSSNRSLTVRFSEPDISNGAVITRYKIQWSKSEHFVPEVGEFVMCDVREKEYTIPDLNKGEKYYVRVSAFNVKGFGKSRMASPPSASPSSWHDFRGSQPRFQGSTTQIHCVAAQLNKAMVAMQQNQGTTPLSQKRNLKKGISKFFGQGAKFHKNLKAGVYLASMIYSFEGRVLVTMDDHIPAVEVFDGQPSSIGTDFAWLAKVACTWENVREMYEISKYYTSSPAIQFRNRLLHAILELQNAFGQADLGLLHHRAYQDSYGAIVFVVVQYVEDYKNLQGVNIKWSNIAKLRKKHPQVDEAKQENLHALELVIQDMISITAQHTQSTKSLSKGLYLGYLKARSSMASMTVVTSASLPNVLPFLRIRNNPNISFDEWKWLRSLSSSEGSEGITAISADSGHLPLQKELFQSLNQFLKILDIPQEEAAEHQLYVEEVIELNEDITFLLVMPPPENVCTPPGSSDQFEGTNFAHLPVSSFELLQLYTYQRAFVTKFSMVSARLDLELLLSQQQLREAFSKAEVEAGKKKNEQLQNFHDQTKAVWLQMRWIETALQSARDPNSESCLPVGKLQQVLKTLPSSASFSSNSSLKRLNSLPHASSSSRYIRVFPAYETGLAKGTSVKIYITLTTTTKEVIRTTVEQLEKARIDRGIPGKDIQQRDLSDFYLAAVLGQSRQDDILPLNFTPMKLLNVSSKYRFFVRRWSLDQLATEV